METTTLKLLLVFHPTRTKQACQAGRTFYSVTIEIAGNFPNESFFGKNKDFYLFLNRTVCPFLL